MILVSIKFPSGGRTYDYIVPRHWHQKICVGDEVVVPPSIVSSQSQVVKVVATGAKPKPNINYVELIGHVDKRELEKAKEARKTIKARVAAEMAAREAYENMRWAKLNDYSTRDVEAERSFAKAEWKKG